MISSSSANTSGDVWGARLDVIGAGNSWGSNKAFYRNSNITSANTLSLSVTYLFIRLNSSL